MIDSNSIDITVLMPVYNAEKYLKESIESILNQTFKNFEFLIIEDGSTDSSVEIIRSFSDPRIRLIQNEKNLGITATLNKGIELASSELIARMDADDISLPERLEKQFDYFQKNPECALLSTAVRRFNSEGTKNKIMEHNLEHFYYFSIFNTWIKHPTVMYKRSAVKEVGKYSRTYAEDFNLWSKIIRKYNFYHINEVLLDYRITAIIKACKKML